MKKGQANIDLVELTYLLDPLVYDVGANTHVKSALYCRASQLPNKTLKFNNVGAGPLTSKSSESKIIPEKYWDSLNSRKSFSAEHFSRAGPQSLKDP